MKRGKIMSDIKLLEKLASYVRLTWDRKLTESTGGNMSVRIGDKVYITPTFFVKHFFTKDDFVVLDMDGKQIGGNSKASSEYKMHIRIYKERKEINSVFHAHPRYTLVYAITHNEVPSNILPETAILLREIEYLSYCLPGTDDFADLFIEGLREGKKIFMLGNHGVTTIGENIEEAFSRLETLETCCFVSTMCKMVNEKIHEIPPEELKIFFGNIKGNPFVK